MSNLAYSGAQVFRFSVHRDHAVKRLRQMTVKYPVAVLDYLLHPDGYRLLLAAKHPGCVSQAMLFFNAATAHDYRRHKAWEGPVWRPRYNLTLVHKGAQAIRCALDMDFAMVRRDTSKQFHPLLWDHSGHQELCEVRKRYRVLDRAALRDWFIDVPWERFREWYIHAGNCKWNAGQYAEESWWDESLLVGTKELCERTADAFPESWFRLCTYPAPTAIPELADALSWAIIMSRKRKREYILSWAQE